MNIAEMRRVVSGLADEVMNGGFNQYFFNSAGNDAAAAIQALAEIGATKTGALLAEACSKFPGGMPSAERFPRQEQIEQVDPDVDVFEALDSAFFAYPEDLAVLLDAYGQRAGT
jgi:Domain of unknown function (DUF4375)